MIIQNICNSYKKELFEGLHCNLDEYKIALYSYSAILNKHTTSYNEINDEVSGEGYIIGGKVLKGFKTLLDDDVAILTFDDVLWEFATITARGALIYNNSTPKKSAVAVLDLKDTYSSINGEFKIIFPKADKKTALLKIS